MVYRKVIPIILIFLFFTLQFFACRQMEVQEFTQFEWSPKAEQALWEKSTTYLFPQSKEELLEEVGATSTQIELGRDLFYEKALSLNYNQSCNTCHDLDNYGVDNERVSEGSNAGLGFRNSPTVFDAAFQYAQFWDGRAKTVEEQAAFPILNPNEMAMPGKEMTVDRLKSIEKYHQKFQEAFPDEIEPITFSNITRAIGAFERTLVTYSRFDDYTAGDLDALSSMEKKGLSLFLDLNCAPCHSGASVGGLMPQRFGQVGVYADYTGQVNSDHGIAGITDLPEDQDMFKVPSLRNVMHTAPYFHDGTVQTIEEAIRIMAKAQLNTTLSIDEVEAIKAFLSCLSPDNSSISER